MKKVLLIACSLIIGTSIFAQDMVKDNSPKYKDLGDWKETAAQQDLRRRTVTDWYLPVNWASSASPNSSNFQSFVSLVFPDSTVTNFRNVSDTDPSIIGSGHSDHSWGHAFDPTDQTILFDQNNLEPLTQHQSYNWDSVFFRYGYVRQIDSFDFGSGTELIVDTMIVRYYTFNTAGMQFGNLTGGNTYANVRSYSAATGYATSFAKEDRIPLTNMDSTTRTSAGWRSSTVSLPVNLAIPAASGNLGNSRVAFTVHFKPQKPYAVGDTLIDFTDQQTINPVNKNNYFVSSYFTDNNAQTQQVPSDGHFNNSVRLSKFSRYGASSNGWTGYIPGNAYFNNQYLNCGFHITSNNVSVRSLKDLGASVSEIYPNPANNGAVAMEVSLRNASDVLVSVTDINGKVVYNATQNVNGTEKVSLNIDNFATGMYNVAVSIEGITTTKKLMVK